MATTAKQTTTVPPYRIKLGEHPVVPELEGEVFRALAEDVKINGIRLPLVVNGRGIIIDGRARYRAGSECGMKSFPVIFVLGLTPEEERIEARRLNVLRRHLSRAQIRALTSDQLRDTSDLCDNAIATVLGVTTNKTVTAERERLVAAREIPKMTEFRGLDGKVYHRRGGSAIAKNSVETQAVLRALPELDETKIPAGLHDARTIIKQAVRAKRERLEEELDRYLSEPYSGELEVDTVREADVRDLDLPEDSFDLFLTDPQYHEDQLDVYEAIAKLASRALKPGCMLFVYCGKQFLPQVIERLGRHLDYVWTMADVYETGDHVVEAVRVKEKYRTILVYKKPGETPKRVLVPDAVHSPKQKDEHEWQNADVAARTYIEAYTRPGDVVLDCCVGGGTVPAVCVELNRHFVAYDIDPKSVQRTLRRLDSVKNLTGGFGTGGGGGAVATGHAIPRVVASSVWDGETPAEITAARAALLNPTDGETGGYEHLPMAEIDALSAGPLTVSLRSSQLVDFHKSGQWVASIPVERAGWRTFFHANGSIKSEGVGPVLNTWSNGCGRRLSGYANCDQRCYQGPGKCSGCYAAVNQWTIHEENQAKHWDIVHNGFITTPDGVVNDCLKLRLPDDGEPGRLTDLMMKAGPFDPPMVRTDCVSTDGSLSLSLGLIQAWAEQNPSVWFYSISSNHFSPSDEMLRWAASIPTIWMGHTISCWFSDAENEVRLAAIRRHLDFGIPTVVWITTSPAWPNDEIARWALELVPPTHIIEAPLQTSKLSKHQPVLNLNPLGACGDMRYDGQGRLATFVERKGKPVAHVMGDDGLERAQGHVSPRCLGCRVKCGYYAIRGMVESAAAASDVWAPQMTDGRLLGGASL